MTLRQARLIAPSIHLAVFAFTWFVYWIQPQPLMNGPARWPFAVIFLADLPISVVAFGAMFQSESAFPYAVTAWGMLGTMMWYYIGRVCLRKRFFPK